MAYRAFYIATLISMFILPCTTSTGETISHAPQLATIPNLQLHQKPSLEELKQSKERTTLTFLSMSPWYKNIAAFCTKLALTSASSIAGMFLTESSGIEYSNETRMLCGMLAGGALVGIPELVYTPHSSRVYEYGYVQPENHERSRVQFTIDKDDNIVDLEGYWLNITSQVDNNPNLSLSFKNMFHDEIASAGSSTRHGATIAYNIEFTPAICALIGRGIQATWNYLSNSVN